MRKQVKRYFRRSLCGILSAAMIAASLIAPDMTVYAAPQDAASLTTENGDDKLVDETTSGKEEGEDKDKDSGSENPGGSIDGDNENADDKDSENGGESGGSSEDGNGSGDNSDGDDKENPDGDDKENPDGDDKENPDEEDGENPDGDQDDLTDDEEDGKDEDLESDDEEEDDEKLIMSPMANEGEYGTLQNGNFEKAVSNDDWRPESWETSGEYKENAEGNESKFLSWWAETGKTAEVTLSQTIENIEPDEYILSMRTRSNYKANDITFAITPKDGGDPLFTTKLGDGPSWEWKDQRIEGIDLSSQDNAPINVVISFSGNLGSGTGFQIDDVSLISRDEALKIEKTLYYYVGETDAEIGLYHTGNNISSKADAADWYVGSAGDTYKMTPVEGYAGWYQIALTFAKKGADSSFAIYNGKDNKLYSCSGTENSDSYTKLATGTEKAYAIKKNICYDSEDKVKAVLRNVTLYVYSKSDSGSDKTPALSLDNTSAAEKLTVLNEDTGVITEITTSDTDEYSNPAWALSKVDGSENWYKLSFVVPGEITPDGKKICGLCYYQPADGNNEAVYKYYTDFRNGANDFGYNFTPVFAGKNYFNKSKFYASMEEAEPEPAFSLKKLQNLIAQAEKLNKDDYISGWDEFKTALTAAKAVAAQETKPTDDEIETAYTNLRNAIKALVTRRQNAEINVDRIALDDDFITGADISSYYALKESGVVFKDDKGNPLSDQGFFNYLYAGGMNWARIRIWNDPYNSSGKGYGGGNNDLEKAKIMGKWASNAGMKVLIDFHYSDFWADPGKQKAPKAWEGMSVADKEKKVYQFTLESLEELRSAGVNVGMVQVGNETNNGICGVTGWKDMAKIFNAGSKAVREFDENCLVAVHFTNPQEGYGGIASQLDTYDVDYDVFASSYYPFGHGDAANLKNVLSDVAEVYGKKVMAAETSWPTTLVDGDGYGTATPPTVPDEYKSQDYGVSVQGQADEMYALIKAVDEINDKFPESSLGVFYWEPAWISPYYIKDDEGNDIDSLYKKNFDLWEKYGSGWASSYAAEYDPEDAGVWFGGSAMDNSSWFDFDGTALPTAKLYSLIRTTGGEAEKRIASVDSNPVKKTWVGESIDWENETVQAKYNDGTETALPVEWEEDETELVDTYKAGEYVVHGIASEGGNNYKITLTVQVRRLAGNNILKNPDFESSDDPTKPADPWTFDLREGDPGDNDAVAFVNDDTPHGGSKGLHFWSKTILDFTVSQTVTPEAGTYTFGGYIQGGGADSEDVQYAFAKVKDKDGNVKSNLTSAFALKGWKNWVNPEITGISVEAGDTIEVGMIMNSTKDGAWGTIDDLYLYGTHTVSIAEGVEHGTVETSVVKADSGERVFVTVTPDPGYCLETMTLSGTSITNDNYSNILQSGNGTVAFKSASGGSANAAVLTYKAEMAEAKSDTFTMPNGNVTVSATFKSVFGETTDKISLDAKTDGKYLVQVNVEERVSPDGENPIPMQFYTGKDVKPAVQLSYKGYQLTSADYTVKYENNKNKTTADNKAKIILTAKGDRFSGKREILFEIGEDTRKDFNAKALKVVFEASDKNGRTDKAAQAVYYLGTEKEIEPKIRLYNASDDIADTSKAIDSSMYEVYYQNNKKIGKATLVVLPSKKALGMPDGYKDGSITTTFTIAKCPVNQQKVTIVMSTKPSYYTGGKAEPAATVTYEYKAQDGTSKKVTLVKGRDYTVTYTNNTNASVYYDAEGKVQDINPRKVPTVKITGKGNFAGVRTTYTVDENGKAGTDKITFQILPRSITNTKITVEDLAENNKAQSPKITVKNGEKTVAASQYVIEEIVRTHDEKNNPLNGNDAANTIYSRTKSQGTPKVTSAGTYKITIAGKEKSNYTDISDELTFKVVAKKNLIANTKIKISGKFYYTGNPVKLSTSGSNPNLTVTAGSDKLTEYASRSAAKDLNGVEQDGYYVTYSNNLSAGKATITVNGTGGYAGTKTATFTINKRAIAKQVNAGDRDKKGELQTPKLSVKVAKVKLDAEWTDGSALINLDDGQSGSLKVPYTGYTIAPDFEFYSNNGGTSAVKMSAGDYTVSYKVGKWTNGTAPVTATVKGKGNYSGSVKIDNLFTLTSRDFSTLSVKVASATYNGKALKPAVTFYNKDGKVVDLKLNTAYSVSYKNNTNSKAVNTDPSKQPTVTVKPKGKGWTSTDNSLKIELPFTIDQAEITKTDVGDVKFQSFLGKALKPKVTIKVNGRKLKEGKDYTLTYSANVKRGDSATVTITGKGNYFTRQPIVKKFVIK